MTYYDIILMIINLMLYAIHLLLPRSRYLLHCISLQDFQNPFELGTIEELMELDKTTADVREVQGGCSAVDSYWKVQLSSHEGSIKKIIFGCTYVDVSDGSIKIKIRKTAATVKAEKDNCLASENNSAGKPPKDAVQSGDNATSVINRTGSPSDALINYWNLPIVIADQNDEKYQYENNHVALFNPVFVRETFNVIDNIAGNTSQDITKFYLMVNATDVFDVQENPIMLSDNNESLRNSMVSMEGCDFYKINITSKSNLLIKNSSLKRIFRCGSTSQGDNIPFMWICAARVTQIPTGHLRYLFSDKSVYFQPNESVVNPLDESPPLFVCLEGKQFMTTYPQLSQVCEFIIRVPSGSNVPTTTSHFWLQTVQSLTGGNCNCMTFPPSATVHSIRHTKVNDRLSVTEVTSDKDISSQTMCTVVGKIKERYHMTPAFDSQKDAPNLLGEIPAVGIPAYKTIRLLLEDDRSTVVGSAEEVAVYLSLKDNLLVGKYYLALLPGATVCLVGVQKRISRTNRLVYLEGKPFTLIKILTIPDARKQTNYLNEDDVDTIKKYKDTAPLKFVFQVANCTSCPQNASVNLENCSPCSTVKVAHTHRNPIFQTFGIITRINKINLSLQCASCRSEVSQSGTCTYVGCYAAPKSVLTGFASFSIEDGGCRAIIIVKRLEIIRILLQISTNAWKDLTDVIVENSCELIYIPTTRSENDYMDPISLIQHNFNPVNHRKQAICRGLTSVIHNYCCSQNVRRKVLLLLRNFKPSTEYSKKQEVSMFYCLDFEDIAPKLHARLLEPFLNLE